VIDRIRLDDSAPVSTTVQVLGASSGNLQPTGHAVQSMATLQHRIIASDEVLPLKNENFGYGRFTRYGGVGELLAQRDDKYVIMRYADKLELTFPSPGQPAAGMTRAFVLKVDLFYKEFNEYKFLAPLPFHGMSTYPYAAPEAYPADEDHNRYLLDYNTREYTQ
jgi:hypothetical protein